MDFFLHSHIRGYSLNSNEIPLALVTGLPYASRHFDLAKKSGRLGHLVIAVIESMPVIGAIAALIDRLFAACFALPAPIPDAPLPIIQASLPEPVKISFRTDSDRPKAKFKNTPLPEPMDLNPSEDINDRLVGKLIAVGKYVKEPGDSACGINHIGDIQGTKDTRRAFLEMLNAGIDLFSDRNLERLKNENKDLYETILIKAYGHIHSTKGTRGNTNLEGSCEALSMLMLLHSVKKLQCEIHEILSYASSLPSAADIFEFIKGKNQNIFDKLLMDNLEFIYNSHDFKAALLSIIENYNKKLRVVEQCLKQACTAESSDEEIKKAFDRILIGDPQIVCSGYDWHSEVIVYSNYEMIYHNRGAIKQNGKEIHVNEMGKDFVTFELLKSLASRFDRVKPSLGNSSDTLTLAYSRVIPRRTIEKKLKDAKGGFCTHTQPKAAIYTLMSLNEGNNRYDISSSRYKLFTYMHRFYFRDVFQQHPIAGLF